MPLTTPFSPVESRDSQMIEAQLLTEVGHALDVGEGRKSRIILYYPDFGALGGIENYILSVSEAVKRRGHFEPVVVCSEGTAFYRQLQQQGIRTYGIRTAAVFRKPLFRMFDFPSMMQLWQIVRQEKPDMVHLHIGQCENLLFSLLGLPMVYTFHGYSSLYSLSAIKSPVKRWLKSLLRPLFTSQLPHLDAMLFVSRAEQSRMLQEGYLSQAYPGEVLYNGIPTEAVKARAQSADVNALRASLGFPKGVQCVSFINRLDPNKNPLQFIALAERIVQAPGLEKTVFLVAGDGPMAGALKARISQSAIQSQICMLGHRNDIPELLSASDLVIFMSQMEGFGLGVLEAMATGTRCVAYAAGGIAELMDSPALQELQVPVGDFETLAQQAIRLLKLTPDAVESLSLALQERASVFDFSVFMEQLETVYHRVLQQNQ